MHRLSPQDPTITAEHATAVPEFSAEKFDRIFQEVDRAGHGVLTCQQVEWFFYLYSVRVAVETGDEPAH